MHAERNTPVTFHFEQVNRTQLCSMLPALSPCLNSLTDCYWFCISLEENPRLNPQKYKRLSNYYVFFLDIGGDSRWENVVYSIGVLNTEDWHNDLYTCRVYISIILLHSVVSVIFRFMSLLKGLFKGNFKHLILNIQMQEETMRSGVVFKQIFSIIVQFCFLQWLQLHCRPPVVYPPSSCCFA